MKDRHAQTRERRRAEPAEAIAAYRATASLKKARDKSNAPSLARE
jgi:hypothetical protein